MTDAQRFEARLKTDGDPAGCRHTEDVGPQGVRYIVGRWPK